MADGMLELVRLSLGWYAGGPAAVVDESLSAVGNVKCQSVVRLSNGNGGSLDEIRGIRR